MSTLFHCDRPEHGYNCSHPDGLVTSEEDELNSIYPDLQYLETLAEVDDEIADVRSEQEAAMDKASVAEGELDDLWKYRRLLAKKLKT